MKQKSLVHQQVLMKSNNLFAQNAVDFARVCEAIIPNVTSFNEPGTLCQSQTVHQIAMKYGTVSLWCYLDSH